MEHRHLNTTKLSLPAIDNIIENGTLRDWKPLIEEIDANPFGQIADKVLHICKHHPVYGGSAFFKQKVASARGELPTVSKEPILNSKPNSWFP